MCIEALLACICPIQLLLSPSASQVAVSTCSCLPLGFRSTFLRSFLRRCCRPSLRESLTLYLLQYLIRLFGWLKHCSLSPCQAWQILYSDVLDTVKLFLRGQPARRPWPPSWWRSTTDQAHVRGKFRSQWDRNLPYAVIRQVMSIHSPNPLNFLKNRSAARSSAESCRRKSL